MTKKILKTIIVALFTLASVVFLILSIIDLERSDRYIPITILMALTAIIIKGKTEHKEGTDINPKIKKGLIITSSLLLTSGIIVFFIAI